MRRAGTRGLTQSHGPDHRGRASIDRLQGRWRNLILVHTPVHPSWLNQAEICHSIIQRKVLEPNDFNDTAEVARTLNEFEHDYSQIAKQFDWNFTREDSPGSSNASTRNSQTGRSLSPPDRDITYGGKELRRWVWRLASTTSFAGPVTDEASGVPAVCGERNARLLEEPEVRKKLAN